MIRGTIDTRNLRRLIKRSQLDCKVGLIGTGKHVQLSLHGQHAETVARHLEQKGLVRTPMSGDGANNLRPISLDYP
jgi:hypothetical protein|tara:strand:+ start:567 stop:794 length:228 start_codon:yes stop_codon:yes gene_type:complete